jgi:hypothetical protein
MSVKAWPFLYGADRDSMFSVGDGRAKVLAQSDDYDRLVPCSPEITSYLNSSMAS